MQTGERPDQARPCQTPGPQGAEMANRKSADSEEAIELSTRLDQGPGTVQASRRPDTGPACPGPTTTMPSSPRQCTRLGHWCCRPFVTCHMCGVRTYLLTAHPAAAGHTLDQSGSVYVSLWRRWSCVVAFFHRRQEMAETELCGLRCVLRPMGR